jgi:hypothetical protein
MSFPISPSSGQQVVVNNILYQYSGVDGTWTRVPVNICAIYDLDDITNYIDGFQNSYPLTYNQTPVSITNPWAIAVTIDGIDQPAFVTNNDVIWQSQVLTSYTGYTVVDGNIKFADPPPVGSAIEIKTQAATNQPATKVYPFRPLDVLMGY